MAFLGNNNLVPEPVLGGPRGQGLWKEFRSVLAGSAFRTQASLIGVQTTVFVGRPVITQRRDWMQSFYEVFDHDPPHL